MLFFRINSIFLQCIFYNIIWLAQPGSAENFLDPNWVDPHSWSVEPNELSKLCPKATPCEPCGSSSNAEYFRLVQSLFNPNEFRYDEETKFMYRTVHIHVTKEQFEKLRDLRDPKHIDGLLSEILAQTNFGTIQIVKEYTLDLTAELWKKIPDIPDLRTLVRSRSILINFLLLVVMYFVCRRFNISYLVAMAFAGVYCLYEYLDYECHKRIELDMEVDFIYGTEQNPCSGPVRNDWFNWIVGKDSRTRCRDFLAKSNYNENQCGIVNLFHEFSSQIMLKQMKMFFFSIAELVHSINSTYGIVAAAITFYFMKDLLVQLVKSTFTHIMNPTVWSRIYADTKQPTSFPAPPPQNQPNYIPNQSNASDIRSLEVDLSNNKFKLTFASSNVIDVLASRVETLSINDRSSGTSVSPLSSLESANTTDDADYSDISDRKPVERKQITEINCAGEKDEIGDIVKLPSCLEECQRVEHISLSSDALTESIILLDETSESTTLSTENVGESGNASTASKSSSQSSSIDSDIEIIS